MLRFNIKNNYGKTREYQLFVNVKKISKAILNKFF